MKKLTYYLFFVIPLIFTNCGSKPNPQVSDNNENIILIQDPYTMDDLLKLKSKFNSNLPEATDELIAIYKDKNQIYLSTKTRRG